MTVLESLAGSYDFVVVSRAVQQMKRAPTEAARQQILRGIDHPLVPEWRQLAEQAWREEQEAAHG